MTVRRKVGMIGGCGLNKQGDPDSLGPPITMQRKVSSAGIGKHENGEPYRWIRRRK